MQYLGGKFRIRKQVADYLESVRPSNSSFVEPFCGACWITSSISGKRFAYDIHPDLICMWRAVQAGWIPPDNVTEEEYNKLKQSRVVTPRRGFVGFSCSFSGKWFGGYARSDKRNYALNARNSILQKRVSLLGVQFKCSDYRKLKPTNSLVYCDPPYAGTTKYANDFNSEEFWDIMRAWSKNNVVVVSEYYAPQDFRCVMSFDTKTDMHTSQGKEFRSEKLFSI